MNQPESVPEANRTQSRWLRKSTLIFVAIVASLVVFGTTTQTWIHVLITAQQVQQANLSIAGNKTAVSVSALAVVALAATLAASIAGNIARIITGILMLLSAAGIIGVVISVLADPSNAAMAEVGKATGVIGVANQATLTVFPAVAMVAAVVLACTSLLIMWQGRKWSVRSRYEAPAARKNGEENAAPIDEIDSWDRLSRGDDPTL